ncbi:MAG: translesion error-prone DNA polymerase V autoproteolytic subunit [Pseudanabaena sp. Salubria-1]|jgi:DNA polymerase V|nr:translesion error-prone DNA polymerase V autoproteolytic subunit [Pseudanabaena sp. Salubria-1]
MPRGGKRQGAGRPAGTGKYNETTKAVRLPISLADEILEALARDPQQVEPATIVSSIFKTDNYTKCRVPLFLNPVAAGFPAPTEDYIEGKIDLNRHLVKHPDSTFLVRVVGESMQDAGIHPRDLLVVDRSLEAISGKVVIAVVDGELTVKRLRKHRNKLWLMPENPNFQPIEIGENMELHIWGVVTNVIHAL